MGRLSNKKVKLKVTTKGKTKGKIIGKTKGKTSCLGVDGAVKQQKKHTVITKGKT